jgi:hypothetical protein
MNAKLENIWTYTPSEDEYGQGIAVSPSMDFTYWIRYHDDYDDGWHSPEPTLTKRLDMTRIDRKGNGEKLKLKINELRSNTDLLAAFADNSRVYVISHRIPEMKSNSKPVKEDLYLHSLGHAEKKLTRKHIDIDFSDGGAVSFLGHNNGQLYFSLQRLAGNKMDIDIFITDMEGQQVDKFTIQPAITGYFKKHFYKTELDNGYVNNNSHFYSPNIIIYNENAFGTVKVNFRTNELYFTALAIDDKDCITGNCSQLFITGFLFNTYTLEGEKIKSVQIPFKESFDDLPEYNKRALTSSGTDLGFLDSNTLKVTISGVNIYTVITMSNGKIKNKYIMEKLYFSNEVYGIFYFDNINANLQAHANYAPKSYIDYVATLKKGYLKSTQYCALTLGTSYILIKSSEQKKETLLEFFLFEE